MKPVQTKSIINPIYILFLMPTLGHTITLHTPNITHKSQYFRSSIVNNDQEISHTWPHISTHRSTKMHQLSSPHATTQIHFSTTSHIANSDPLLNPIRGNQIMQFSHQSSTQNTVLQLQFNMTRFSNEIHQNTQAPNTTFDGSIAGFVLNNWLISIGAIDRWWGPTWQSPLLLSNNARPIPALSLDRIESYAPTTFGFQWIGPWQLNTFLGQLESDRAISNPLFWGIRMSAMPIQNVEIAVNRTAIFGGEGRNLNSRVFYNVITGQDNDSDQPGNQLGSFDLSYRFGTQSGSYQYGHEFYLELAGEDEAGGAPTQKFSTFGYTGFLAKAPQNHQKSWHYLIEFSDTTAGSFGEKDIQNITYKHHIYKTGYTHHGQVIGSPLGGDTQGITLGLWLDQNATTKKYQKSNNTGLWLSRKTFADTTQVMQLSFWTHQPCGPLHCSLSFNSFNQPMSNQRINPNGKRFTVNASIHWTYKPPS